MERSLVSTLVTRCQKPIHAIQVVVGPRQVGKTTAVHTALQKLGENTLFASADQASPPSRSWLESLWETARLQCRSGNGKLVLAIDEIQQVGDWARTVKALWDKDRREGLELQPILLGSSALLLHEGLNDALMGRFELHTLGHWSLQEMRECFGWTAEQFVWWGGYPGAAPLIEDSGRWQCYVRDSLVEASLGKDVLGIARIHKPSLLRNLFELGCAHSGQILAFNKILGQLDDAGNTTTLANYLATLDRAGLLAGLEKHTNSQVRRRSSSPKFQVHNNALLTVFWGNPRDVVQRQPELWGRMVESAVGAHLLAESRRAGVALRYWRAGNDEMDFVLQQGKQVVGLEVKANAAKRTRGMDAFCKEFPEAKVILIGESGIPWQDFLSMDVEEVFR